MKKKLLFVMNSLGCGGAEKSLVTLLNHIDYSKYEVDLYLFEKIGIFMETIPQHVKLLPVPKYWNILNSPFKSSVMALARERRYDIIGSRIAQSFICRNCENQAAAEQRLWRYIRNAFEQVKDEYDAVIGYLEKNPIYFAVDKVRAKKKIGWIHASYKDLGIKQKLERRYFEKLDSIVSVSKQAADELKDLFPEYEKKIHVINNIISPELIKSMSGETVNRMLVKKHMIVTVARLEYPKGIDMAIKAGIMLSEAGYDFTWQVLGEGHQRGELENEIKRKGMEGIFILEGVKANPYPYVRHADIYVQPSRSEAFGLAIAEARVLDRPIVSTGFPAAVEQICSGVDGLIVDMNAESIYKGIRALLDNPHLRRQFSNSLKKLNIGNQGEINRFYNIIED